MLPDPGMAHLRIVNSLPCSATVKPSWQPDPLVLPSMDIHRFVVSSDTERLRVDFSVGDCPGSIFNQSQGSQELVVKNMKVRCSRIFGVGFINSEYLLVCSARFIKMDIKIRLCSSIADMSTSLVLAVEGP